MAITIRLGTPADNAKIQDLVTKITMPGPAQMCFQRAPDFFTGAKVIGDDFVLTVADDDERPDVLAGLTVFSGRDLYISGKPRRVYYSGDTRVDPYYRRRGIASQMFIEQKKYRQPDELLQGIVLKENTAPLDAAAKAADGVLFRYWISHTIETSFIFVRKIKPRIPAGVTIRAATAADAPAMQAFMDREAPRRNGYPVYSLEKLMAGDPYYNGLRIGDYALALRDGQIIGFVAGFACLWGVSGLKKLIGADDSLDVFGVHGVGGIVGALLTGVFNSPALGGPSAVGDWVTASMIAPDAYSIATQFITQAKAVGVTIVWSGVVSVIAYKLVDLTIGLRVTEEEEREGLDISSHGETAYHK